MSLRRVSSDIGAILAALRIPFSVISLNKKISVQYVINEFGVVISLQTESDLSIIRNKIERSFYGYRYIFVYINDDLEETRYKIIWDLMRSGYMIWLRETYGQRFINFIDENNFGTKIIDERLRIWNNKAKFGYLIRKNLEAKEVGYRRTLATDPSFFDYMP